MNKLLVVESPTKARTIKKFLGSKYDVVSSYGHIRDLPKKEMGVDFEHGFKPKYVISTDKKKHVAGLKKAAKKADEIYLATDEDREGEAIAWHIAQVLDLNPDEVKRITFHEITKHAIDNAIKHPRTLSEDLVNAQQTRRILDRIVGYELSPFLWKKVRRGLSAGRVQSVAMRLSVERERERQAFNKQEYWTIEGEFEKNDQTFPAKLKKRGGKTLKKLDIANGKEANGIVSDLKDAPFKVDDVRQKKATKKPPKPITTSTLQQEAHNKLGFSAKQTMRLAQKLYETGRITYMRTDSVNLSEKFLAEAQTFINAQYGNEYAKGAVTYKTKSKGAQEAHEAIRPTDPSLKPEQLKGKVEARAFKLYRLIWSRTLATQMPAANIERTAVDITAKQYMFRANGSVIVFDGFMKVYRSAKEKLLPDLKAGDKVNPVEVVPKQHFTEPPARYSDATLIKALEKNGIGRPSTYAPTISTLIDRGYLVRDDNKKLAPTDIAMIVNDLLVEHFTDIVDYDFTAKLEKSLDEIAEGKIHWKPMLEAFYLPFHKNLEEKSDTLSREDIMPARELGKDPKTGKTVYVKTGRYGPYFQLGEWSKKKDAPKPKMTSIPKGKTMDEVTLKEALDLLELPRTVGTTEDGKDIKAQIGPYGPYLKAGKLNASLPEEQDIMKVDEKTARKILKEAAAEKKKRETPLAKLGKDPKSGGKILVKIGPYGPYVTDGKTNASVPKGTDPKTVTHEEAVELLKKKRENKGKGRWRKKKRT